MSKYDWSRVPEHIKWIARDKSNKIYGYDKEPSRCFTMSIWKGDNLSDYYHIRTRAFSHQGDWQDSLEERPE